MNIRFTKSSSDTRMLQGISINEIEEAIEKGIKSIDKLGISSTKDNLAIVYSIKDNTHIIKRLMVK